MSNLKRKVAPGEQPPAKSAKSSKEGRPSKSETATKASKPKSAAKNDGPVVSLLKSEEPAFPRGGGSVLTPLEQKQISLEARADARRDEEFDVGSKAQKKQKKTPSTKSSKTGSKKKDDSEDAIKVESLNFKVSNKWTATGLC